MRSVVDTVESLREHMKSEKENQNRVTGFSTARALAWDLLYNNNNNNTPAISHVFLLLLASFPLMLEGYNEIFFNVRTSNARPKYYDLL